MNGTHSSDIVVPGYIKGLIFDCDGTLVDSMPLHLQCWKDAMEHFGAIYDEEYFLSKRGMKETEIIDEYNALFGTQLHAADVVAEKHRCFSGHISNVTAIHKVVEIVHRFNGVLPMAVVSGSVEKTVLDELRVIGIDHLFAVILTADSPFRQKPAPDMFLEAAKTMRVLPSLCQVFEDGDLGLRAAKHAGMLATDIRRFI